MPPIQRAIDSFGTLRQKALYLVEGRVFFHWPGMAQTGYQELSSIYLARVYLYSDIGMQHNVHHNRPIEHK